MSYGGKPSFYTPYAFTEGLGPLSCKDVERENPMHRQCYRGDGSLLAVLRGFHGVSMYVMEVYLTVVWVMLTAKPGVVVQRARLQGFEVLSQLGLRAACLERKNVTSDKSACTYDFPSPRESTYHGEATVIYVLLSVLRNVLKIEY